VAACQDLIPQHEQAQVAHPPPSRASLTAFSGSDDAFPTSRVVNPPVATRAPRAVRVPGGLTATAPAA
jgi:hypothetical protein